jgi:flagellar basal-body rod protein FlgC
MPGHPDANAEGYVAFPKMNPAEDMADLLNTTRSYQANIAAMTAVKDMINNSITLLK